MSEHKHERERNPSIDRRDDGAFLHDLFAESDPLVANFMARHNALLERVTVLERALEKIRDINEHSPLRRAQALAREALDA